MDGATTQRLPPLERVYACMRMSMAAYESKGAMEGWETKGTMLLKETMPWFAPSVSTTEFTYVASRTTGWEKDGAEGEDRGRYHKCQWAMAIPTCEPTTLVVAFKGTDNPVDLVLDSSLHDTVTPMGARLHSGFYSGVRNDLEYLIEHIKKAVAERGVSHVAFTGHSLGGAYATVTLLELLGSMWWPQCTTAECITFGSPLVMCAEVKGGMVRLPVALSVDPPPMLHFVSNFDLVPRGFALSRDGLIGLIEVLPGLASAALQTIASMARNLGLAQPDIVVDIFEPLRSTYRAVGTFAFLQSYILPGDPGESGEGLYHPPTFTRYTACHIVHPTCGPVNETAESLLRYFPSIDPSSPCHDDARSLSGRLAFMTNSIADHSTAASYYPAIEHLAVSYKEQWGTIAHPCSTGKRDLLIAHAMRNFDPMISFVLPKIPPELCDALGREECESVVRSMEELSAKLQRLAESREGKKDVITLPPSGAAYRVAPSLCPVANAINNLDEEEQATTPEAKTPSKSKKKSKAHPKYIVSKLDHDVSLVFKPCHDDDEGWEGVLRSGKALSLTRCHVGDEVEVVREAETLFSLTLSAAKGKGTTCLVLEMSHFLGYVVWDSGVISDAPKAGFWGWWGTSQCSLEHAEGRQRDIRAVYPDLGGAERGADSLLMLHKLSMYASQGSARSIREVDREARGMGVLRSNVQGAGVCAHCSVALKIGGHHCKVCGVTVCGSCSTEKLTWLKQYGADPQLTCKKCQEVVLAPLRSVVRKVERPRSAPPAPKDPEPQPSAVFTVRRHSFQPQW